MVGHTALDHEHRQDFQHIICCDRARHYQGQTLAGEFVQDHQDAKQLAVMGRISDEVVAPDVIRMRRSHPNARAVTQKRPSSGFVLLLHLEPLTPPRKRERRSVIAKLLNDWRALLDSNQ
jgi:hypothetical protein